VEFRIVTAFNSKGRRIQRLAEELELRNITFLSETSCQNLVQMMNDADLCLGVFGDNAKAEVVIPNKLYEAAACGRPTVTAEHPAVREVFTNGKNIVFCRPACAEDLAEKILDLRGNERKRKEIGENALHLVNEHLTPRVVVAPLVRLLESEGISQRWT
jgi:glycosyltransferase involved in cell wall biosynthesis